MLIATTELWTDATETRSCRILSYDKVWELELRAFGQRLMLQSFDSIEEAVKSGELWRAALLEMAPQAA